MQATDDLDAQVSHGYVDHDGVKIHYASLGAGPLVVLIHGFPDYWETWRAQMPALAAAGYRAVALDLRGYNLSDKPAGDAAYAMPLLIGDIVAVIRACGEERATIIGHDWGGIIAWQLAMHVPAAVTRLVVLSTPHPALLAREPGDKCRDAAALSVCAGLSGARCLSEAAMGNCFDGAVAERPGGTGTTYRSTRPL